MSPYRKGMEDPRLSPEQSEEEEAEWRKVLRVKQATLGIVVLLLILCLIGGTLFFIRLGNTTEAIRDTQETGSPLLRGIDSLLDELAEQQDDIEAGTKASVETNERILDCLNQGGDCYRENRKNGAAQVLSITSVTIIAAACGPMVTADMPLETRYAIIRHCVARFVEEPR